MKKYAAIVFSLFALVGMVTAGFARIRRAEGMEVQFNKRDFPEHGVHIITSVDPSFEALASGYFKAKAKNIPESLNPFSVFIKNSGNKTVVAYALRWQMVRADGQVIQNTTSYSEPGVLMGNEMPNNPAFKHIDAIEPGAVRCFSWDSPIREDTSQPLGGGDAPVSGKLSPNQFKDPIARRDNIRAELSLATDLTVSLDGVFFDDGTFIGPNITGFFERIQSVVNAKVDLLREIEIASQTGTVEQAIENITVKSKGPDVVLAMNSSAEDYYNCYTKLFATEIANMTGAYDKQGLVAHLVNSYKRRRTLLRKE